MPKPTHILHIDDREDDRMLFAAAFGKSALPGVLHSMTNAAEAMLYLKQLGPYRKATRPRLIVLDLSLPCVDGREFLELLRDHASFKTIPVVILTSSKNEADISRCRELGVEGYLIKPRLHEELVILISSFAQILADSSTGLPAVPPGR